MFFFHTYSFNQMFCYLSWYLPVRVSVRDDWWHLTVNEWMNSCETCEIFYNVEGAVTNNVDIHSFYEILHATCSKRFGQCKGWPFNWVIFVLHVARVARKHPTNYHWHSMTLSSPSFPLSKSWASKLTRNLIGSTTKLLCLTSRVLKAFQHGINKCSSSGTQETWSTWGRVNCWALSQKLQQ